MFEMKPIHIGVLVEDMQEAMKEYAEKFGITEWEDFGELKENALYYGEKALLCYHAAMAPFGQLQLELIQPTAEGSVFWDDLKKKGPGMHHVCIMVDDIEKTVEECKAIGYTIREQVPMYEMEPGFSLGFCFVTTESGMTLELVQEVHS